MVRGSSIKFNPLNESLAVTTGYNPFLGAACLLRFTIEQVLRRSTYFISPYHDLHDCSWSSSNPNLIIVATDEGSYLIDFSLPDDNPREYFLGHKTTSLDWHPKHDSFISASDDVNVKHWSIDQVTLEHTYKHPARVSSVTWNPQEPSIFASTCYDRILRIWDIRNQNPVITIEADDTSPISCDWNSHQKTCIATSSHHSNYIKVWDITQPNNPIKVLIGAHTAGVHRVKFSPHREYQIASASSDHTVAVWDYGPEDADPTFTTYRLHGTTVVGLDMSKLVEGQLASCEVDGYVRVWQHALPEAPLSPPPPSSSSSSSPPPSP